MANVPGTNFPVTNPGITPPNFTASGLTPANLGGNFDPSGLNQPNGFNQPPVPNQQNLNQGFNATGSIQPGGVPGQFPGSNVGAPPGVPGVPGVPGAPSGPGGSNQAINLINQLLTQPRQPPAGIGANQQPTGGGGLAGVASTYKGTTIKSYGDHTKYQEWEFVFQLNQQGTGIQVQPGTGPNGSGGIPSGAPGAPGASGAPGSAGASGAAPFPGSSSQGIGGGAASPFGTSGIGTSGAGTSGFGTSR